MPSSFWTAAMSLALALLLLPVAAGAADTEATNLLKNPGFDTGKLGWRGDGRVKDKAEIGKPAADDPPKAKPDTAKKNAPDVTDANRDGVLEIKLSTTKTQELFQTFRTPAAGRYSFSFSYRVSDDFEFADKSGSESMFTRNLWLQIHTVQDGMRSGGSGTFCTPKTGLDWHQYSGGMTHGSASKDTQFSIQVPKGKGRIWFDDFTLVGE